MIKDEKAGSRDYICANYIHLCQWFQTLSLAVGLDRKPSGNGQTIPREKFTLVGNH